MYKTATSEFRYDPPKNMLFEVQLRKKTYVTDKIKKIFQEYVRCLHLPLIYEVK